MLSNSLSSLLSLNFHFLLSSHSIKLILSLLFLLFLSLYFEIIYTIYWIFLNEFIFINLLVIYTWYSSFIL